MADVEMTDAGAAPKVAKNAKAGASGADSKKDKFEVKKVRRGYITARLCRNVFLTNTIVERRRAVGLGHRCRQLCHLPQPHHGPVHRLSSEPGFRHHRGVHSRLGNLQCKSSHVCIKYQAFANICRSTHFISTASPVG